MTHSKVQTEWLERIYRLMSAGDFQNAGKQCELLTAQFPDYADAWVVTAEFFLRVSNPQRALEVVENAIRLSPEDTNWLLLQGRCLIECGETSQVRMLISRLLNSHQLAPRQRNELGMLMARIDDHRDAQEQYLLAVAALPGETEFLFNLATSQRFLGETDAADETLNKLMNLDPQDHEAAAMRSSLKKQSVDDNHISGLKSTLKTGALNRTGQVSFCFALAKELEDIEDYEASFSYLKRGADLRRSGMRYDVSTDVAIMEQIIQVFNTSYFAENRKGHENDEAIFIIGLPRSGTTLLERILASHSDVYAAGELGHFGTELTRLTRQSMAGKPKDRSQFVSATAQIDYQNLGERYIQCTRPLTGKTPNFIDKLPFNYLYAGLIHQALPNAKIISLQRNPMDSCYSMYKQLFRDAYPFSYDLNDLASYYLSYRRLMDHWDRVIPGVIHKVQYEDIVNNTEQEARRLLDYCGLEWQQQCLEFHRNTSASTTASATQVRQKIYSSSVGKWRNYQTELSSLENRFKTSSIEIF